MSKRKRANPIPVEHSWKRRMPASRSVDVLESKGKYLELLLAELGKILLEKDLHLNVSNRETYNEIRIHYHIEVKDKSDAIKFKCTYSSEWLLDEIDPVVESLSNVESPDPEIGAKAYPAISNGLQESFWKGFPGGRALPSSLRGL